MDDLASLSENTSLKFTYAQAKGRNNFYCGMSVDNSLENGGAQSAEEERKLRVVIDKFSGGWSGDFEKLKGHFDTKIQNLCTSTSESCNRRTCPYAQECPYYANIDNMRKADVVVANHSLTAAMAEIGFGTYLKGDDSECRPLLALDEAHHFHSLFRDSMSLQLNFSDASKKLKSNTRFSKELSGQKDIAHQADEAQNLANDIISVLSILSNETQQTYNNEKQQRFDMAKLSDHYREQLTTLKLLSVKASKVIAKINSYISKESCPLPEATSASVTVKVSVAGKLLENIANIVEAAHQDIPKASWFSFKGMTSAMHICPLEVSELFKEKIVDQCHSITMVSATLRTEGNFNHIIQRLGVS
jgi:Rad3-related DNA helicase